jgi:hypothetical protein
MLALPACTGSPDPAPDPGNADASAGSPSEPKAAPADPDAWRRSVPLDPLSVPAEMVATTDRLDLGGLVGGNIDRPALVAAVRTEPGGRRHLPAGPICSRPPTAAPGPLYPCLSR